MTTTTPNNDDDDRKNSNDNNNHRHIVKTDETLEERVERKVAERLAEEEEIERRVAQARLKKGGKAVLPQPQPSYRQGYITPHRPSAAWYLLPIFFGFLGGIFMFWALKDEDRGRAKGGLFLGIILSIIGAVFFLMVLAAA